MDIVTDNCPWCGSIISRDKFKEIEAKIRIEEQKKLEAAEAALRQRLEAEKQAAEERIRNEANKQVTTLSAELKQTQALLKQSEAARAEIYKQAQKEAERKVKQERDQEIRNLRLVLENDHAQKLLKQQEEFQQRLDTSQKKAEELSKQLQQKAAQDIEGSTIDVFEELQTKFPDDSVTRLHQGKPNEKILHKVFYKGQSCGSIVVDSRNRQSWQNGFATKLRVEQVELSAEHAILSTTAFPKGKKELCIEDDVIIVNPNRIIYVVDLLRKAMIKMHIQGLSMVDRTSKVSRLYEFICSQEYTQKCSEAASLTDGILEIDVEEAKQHRKVWEKRGAIATRLKNVLQDIDLDIGVILEGGPEDKAKGVKSAGAAGQRHLRRVQ